jgi:hypothetical protein
METRTAQKKAYAGYEKVQNVENQSVSRQISDSIRQLHSTCMPNVSTQTAASGCKWVLEGRLGANLASPPTGMLDERRGELSFAVDDSRVPPKICASKSVRKLMKPKLG